jgi:hypothetical protein
MMYCVTSEFHNASLTKPTGEKQVNKQGNYEGTDFWVQLKKIFVSEDIKGGT